MNKYHLKKTLNSKKISVERLSIESGVSIDVIDHMLDDIDTKINWYQAMRIAEAIEKIIDENFNLARLELTKEMTLEEQLAESRARIMRLKDLSTKLRSESIEDMENVPAFKRRVKPEQLFLTIDKGNTPDEEIALLLSEISILYRMQGGSGINFEIQGIDTLQLDANA